MANEYTLDQGLIQRFGYADLPTEQHLQRQQQQRQEGMIAQARQKRLQEQRKEAQALKANQGGFGNQDEYAHWGSALAGLGNIAAGHANEQRTNLQQIGNEHAQGRGAAAQEQMQQEAARRAEQNKIAQATQQQYNTEEANRIAGERFQQEQAFKGRQLRQAKAIADRTAAQKALDSRLGYAGKKPIDYWNPTTGKGFKVSPDLNDEGTLPGYRYLHPETGEPTWSQELPNFEGYGDAEANAEKDPLTAKQRGDFDVDLTKDVAEHREVLGAFNQYYDIAKDFAVGGKYQDKIPQLGFGMVNDVMIEIEKSKDFGLYAELQAALSNAQTEGTMTSTGTDKSTGQKDGRDERGQKRTTGTPLDKFETHTVRGKMMKTIMEKAMERANITTRNLLTGKAEAEGGAHGKTQAEVSRTVDVARWGKALLAMEDMGEEAWQLLGAMVNVQAKVMKVNTGLEATKQIFKQNASILGMDEMVPPMSRMELFDSAYATVLNDVESKLEPYGRIGNQGRAPSILDSYMEGESNIRTLYEMPPNWENLRGQPGLMPGDIERLAFEKGMQGEEVGGLEAMTDLDLNPFRKKAYEKARAKQKPNLLEKTSKTLEDSANVPGVPLFLKGTGLGIAKGLDVTEKFFPDPPPIKLVNPEKQKQYAKSLPKSLQPQNIDKKEGEYMERGVLPAALSALAQDKGIKPPSISLGEDKFMDWVLEHSKFSKAVARQMYRQAVKNDELAKARAERDKTYQSKLAKMP